MNEYTVKCHYCGERFSSPPVENKGKKYCSDMCKQWDEEPDKHPPAVMGRAKKG